jgi:molecular chaperone GrpE
MTEHEHHHASHGKPHGPAAPHEPAKTPPDLPPAAGAADLQKQLEAKTREAAELLDQLKRVAAEYSNYQKRMQRHLDEEKNLAVRALVLDLLPALDNFDRALAATGGQFKPETLLEGVTLVHQQLLAALAKHGVKPIDAGATFDPEHHEAVACLPSETHAQGQVIEQLQRGYQLHGRTIRPAHVAVSGGAPEPPQDATKEGPVEPSS